MVGKDPISSCVMCVYTNPLYPVSPKQRGHQSLPVAGLWYLNCFGDFGCSDCGETVFEILLLASVFVLRSCLQCLHRVLFTEKLLKEKHRAAVIWFLSSGFLNPSSRPKQLLFHLVLNQFWYTEVCVYSLRTTFHQTRLKNTLLVWCVPW